MICSLVSGLLRVSNVRFQTRWARSLSCNKAPNFSSPFFGHWSFKFVNCKSGEYLMYVINFL